MAILPAAASRRKPLNVDRVGDVKRWALYASICLAEKGYPNHLEQLDAQTVDVIVDDYAPTVDNGPAPGDSFRFIGTGEPDA